MDYRILELMAPTETAREARDIAEQEENALGIWSDTLDDDSSVIRILMEADKTESLTDTFTDKFSGTDGFRIMLFSVEATLPHPETEKEEEADKSEDDSKRNRGRISREELYADLNTGSELDWVYIAMVILSTLVAGVGLIRDDVAVIIGAMVIAPLLAPNVSMALAATLGDPELGWRSFKTNLAGLLASLAVAFIMGLTLQFTLESEQLVNRTMVNFGDITIALAAGSAGVLAFTRGVPAAIVGVMVAVAVLPPLVVTGLLLGSGYTFLAIGAMILTFSNLICINLAGILTFLVQGIRPRTFWETQKAKNATRAAVAIWFALFVILAIIIWFWDITPDDI